MSFFFPVNLKGSIGDECCSTEYVREQIENARDSGSEIAVFYMHTAGGDIETKNEIREAIINCGLRTVAFIEGRADSSGSVIAIACDRVICRPDARMLLHEPSFANLAEQDLSNHQRAWLRQAHDELVGQYRERSPHLSVSYIESLMKADTDLDADQMVALGFADEILPYGCRVNLEIETHQEKFARARKQLSAAKKRLVKMQQEDATRRRARPAKKTAAGATATSRVQQYHPLAAIIAFNSALRRAEAASEKRPSGWADFSPLEKKVHHLMQLTQDRLDAARAVGLLPKGGR